MEYSGKKKVDPRWIDKQAIRELVGGKSPQRIVAKPSEERDTVSIVPEQPIVQTERPGRMLGHETILLHGIRSEKRKSLHIDAGLHHQLCSLIWAIGCGDITMEGLVNRLLTQHFEEYKDVLNAMTEDR
ncbi:DUF3408 domain-containing protein [Parabacteroides goldsteinii]|uniref:DUF3408 domain-containing protein n=1 Tax=Parabacteroides goldsteinii TaxID=328812 RepID=UPI0013EBF881|nr:DUF3408 domain-containing protein [Parabacteroides goldsteinii]